MVEQGRGKPVPVPIFGDTVTPVPDGGTVNEEKMRGKW